MTTTTTKTACRVSLGNYSPQPFVGWIRRTIDVLPRWPAGEGFEPDGTPFVRYVVGRQVGLSTWVVDVWCKLDPNEHDTFDLDELDQWKFEMPAPKPNPVAFFGGMPSVNGVEMQLRAADRDGAGIGLRFEGRIGPMLHVTLWALWRPSEPGIVHAEVVVCAANPEVPDVIVSTGDLRLSWGDAIVHVPGAGWNAPIVPATWFADGQARGVPVTLVWLHNLEGEWLAAIAAVMRATCGTGLQKLLPGGNPRLPEDFDGAAWCTETVRTDEHGKRWSRYEDSLRRLHTWEHALLGPNPRSGDTGAQEDQVFVRGEPFGADGDGCEEVAYFAALKILARPCHHLTADGAIVDPRSAAPRLLYWDGYVHWHAGASPNRLGKPRTPKLEESQGWSGPDVEHWLINTLAAAARFTGSHALQWELRHQAHVYFGQQTIVEGWSTSQPYAARAVGWEAWNVVLLWHALEDRELAGRVRMHWALRWVVIAAAYGDREIVDIRVDDDRLGPGAWWMPWQQAVAAYGLDVVGAEFGNAHGRSTALRLAKAVLQHAWTKVGSRWCTAPVAPVPSVLASAPEGAILDVSRARRFVHEDTGVPVIAQATLHEAFAPAVTPMFDEAFNAFGMPLAIAVVLRHEPDHAIAREIWQQCLDDNRGHSWLPPEVSL